MRKIEKETITGAVIVCVLVLIGSVISYNISDKFSEEYVVIKNKKLMAQVALIMKSNRSLFGFEQTFYSPKEKRQLIRLEVELFQKGDRSIGVSYTASKVWLDSKTLIKRLEKIIKRNKKWRQQLEH